MTSQTQKRIRVSVMAAVGTAAVLGLLAFEEGGSIPVRTLMVWMVSLGLTGWGLLLGEVLPLRLPDSYFAFRGHEIRLYRRLGVPAFGRLLRWGPCSFMIGGGPTDIGANSIKQFNHFTRKSEFLHVVACFICLVPLAYWISRGWWWGAVWFALFNIFFNAYPIMLQRYNRFRLSRVFKEAGEAGWALEDFAAVKQSPQSPDL